MIDLLKKKDLRELAIDFQNNFSHISPRDLDEIMEFFYDSGYLTKQGIDFRRAFWGLFVKVRKN